jgi:hypothetical protein
LWRNWWITSNVCRGNSVAKGPCLLYEWIWNPGDCMLRWGTGSGFCPAVILLLFCSSMVLSSDIFVSGVDALMLDCVSLLLCFAATLFLCFSDVCGLAFEAYGCSSVCYLCLCCTSCTSFSIVLDLLVNFELTPIPLSILFLDWSHSCLNPFISK